MIEMRQTQQVRGTQPGFGVEVTPRRFGQPLLVAAVDGRFENTGQACNAAKRFIVSEGIYDEFLDKFTKKVLAKADSMAPLSSVAAAERLEDQVKRAVDDGATLISDGERKGAFFPPGVLTGVSPDSPSYREELFGPVATVYKVGSEDEATRFTAAVTELNRAREVAGLMPIQLVDWPPRAAMTAERAACADDGAGDPTLVRFTCR